MPTNLMYMPVLRLRQEEQKVLTSFDFGPKIYPCVEIIKEVDRLPPTTRKGKKLPPKNQKTFEEVHLPIIAAIKANRVFIDIPVHMVVNKRVKPEVVRFLTKVAGNRKERTDYLIKLQSLAGKIIPVISTYAQRTG